MEKIFRSFEVDEVSFVQLYLVDKQYQEKSEVLYTFTPNKSYMYQLNVELGDLVFLEIYDTEFYEIIITFTDKNGGLLEIENNVNLRLLVNRQK